MDKQKWRKLSFIEQMANLGADVGRTINWHNKDIKLSNNFYFIALELWNLTMNDTKNKKSLKELRLKKKTFVNWFTGKNLNHKVIENLENYFYQFNLAARLNR
jgi:hypothetical protein